MTQKMKDGNIQIGNTKVAVQDANGNFRSMTDIVADVTKATEGMGDAEKTAALMSTFTADSIKAMGIMCNTGADDIDAFTKELQNSDGTAKETADTMNNTLSGAIKELGSAWEALQLSMGDTTGVLTKLIKGLTKLVRWFKDLPGPVKQFIMTIALIAATVGPTLLIIGKAIDTFVKMKNTINTLKTVFSLFNGSIGSLLSGAFTKLAGFVTGSVMPALSSLWGVLMANPIILIIAAIAALVAAFIWAWNNVDGFKEFWINLWETVKQAAINGWNAVVNFFTTTLPQWFNNIVSWFQQLPYKIAAYLAVAIVHVRKWKNDMIQKAIELGSKFIQSIVNFFKQLPGKIKAYFNLALTYARKWLHDMITKAKETGSKFLNGIITFIQQLPDKVWSWLTNTLSKVSSWASNMTSKAREAGSNFIGNVITFIQQLPGKVGSWLTNTISKVASWVSNMWLKGIEAGSKFVSSVITFITQLPGNIAYCLGFALGKIILWVATLYIKGKEAGSKFINGVILFFQQLPGKLWSLLVTAINKVTAWISNMYNKGKQAGSRFVNAVITFIKQLPGKVWSWLTNVISKVATWASNMASKARQAGSNFLRNVISFIQQLPGKLWSLLLSAIAKVTAFVSQMRAKASQAASNFISRIASGLASLPSKLASIGRNAVQGLIRGLKSGASALWNAAQDLASKAWNGMKSALGIHSPSKVMAEKVGQWIPKGVTVGIQANAGNTLKAIRDYANSLVNEIDTNKFLGQVNLATSGININTEGSNYDNMALAINRLSQAVIDNKQEIDYDKMGAAFTKGASNVQNAVFMDKTVVGRMTASTVKQRNDYVENQQSRFRGDKDYV